MYIHTRTHAYTHSHRVVSLVRPSQAVAQNDTQNMYTHILKEMIHTVCTHTHIYTHSHKEVSLVRPLKAVAPKVVNRGFLVTALLEGQAQRA
jgi:hypothetical protein